MSVWAIILPILPFLPFFVIALREAMRRRACPGCGARLSGFQSPLTKTRRQWLEGGYLCGRCGVESDLAGRVVAKEVPVERPSPALIASIFMLVALSVVLTSSIYFLTQINIDVF
jgi:hypothetical protein